MLGNLAATTWTGSSCKAAAMQCALLCAHICMHVQKRARAQSQMPRKAAQPSSLLTSAPSMLVCSVGPVQHQHASPTPTDALSMSSHLQQQLSATAALCNSSPLQRAAAAAAAGSCSLLFSPPSLPCTVCPRPLSLPLPLFSSAFATATPPVWRPPCCFTCSMAAPVSRLGQHHRRVPPALFPWWPTHSSP